MTNPVRLVAVAPGTTTTATPPPVWHVPHPVVKVSRLREPVTPRRTNNVPRAAVANGTTMVLTARHAKIGHKPVVPPVTPTPQAPRFQTAVVPHVVRVIISPTTTTPEDRVPHGPPRVLMGTDTSTARSVPTEPVALLPRLQTRVVTRTVTAMLNAPARQTTPALLSGITPPNLGWVRVLQITAQPMRHSAAAFANATPATVVISKSRAMLGRGPAPILMNVLKVTLVNKPVTTPMAHTIVPAAQAMSSMAMAGHATK